MAIARFGRVAKRSYKSYGFCVKLTSVVILGLCFVFIWSVFSPSSFSVTTQRETFDDIAEPISANGKASNFGVNSNKKESKNSHQERNKEDKKMHSSEEKEKTRVNNGSIPLKSGNGHKIHKEPTKDKKRGGNLKPPQKVDKDQIQGTEGSEDEDLQEEKQEEDLNSTEEESMDGEGNGNEEAERDSDLTNAIELDQDSVEKLEDDNGRYGTSKKNKKKLGPLFDPKAHYTWKLCSSRSKHNYIPCIDIETASGRLQSYRHHERSCPRTPLMCLVPLPLDGYETPVRWPESKEKVCNSSLMYVAKCFGTFSYYNFMMLTDIV